MFFYIDLTVSDNVDFEPIDDHHVECLTNAFRQINTVYNDIRTRDNQSKQMTDMLFRFIST